MSIPVGENSMAELPPMSIWRKILLCKYPTIRIESSDRMNCERRTSSHAMCKWMTAYAKMPLVDHIYLPIMHPHKLHKSHVVWDSIGSDYGIIHHRIYCIYMHILFKRYTRWTDIRWLRWLWWWWLCGVVRVWFVCAHMCSVHSTPACGCLHTHTHTLKHISAFKSQPTALKCYPRESSHRTDIISTWIAVECCKILLALVLLKRPRILLRFDFFLLLLLLLFRFVSAILSSESIIGASPSFTRIRRPQRNIVCLYMYAGLLLFFLCYVFVNVRFVCFTKEMICRN